MTIECGSIRLSFVWRAVDRKQIKSIRSSLGDVVSTLGVDWINLCPDICVKDSETDSETILKTYPYGWDHMANIPYIEGLQPDECLQT